MSKVIREPKIGDKVRVVMDFSGGEFGTIGTITSVCTARGANTWRVRCDNILHGAWNVGERGVYLELCNPTNIRFSRRKK